MLSPYWTTSIRVPSAFALATSPLLCSYIFLRQREAAGACHGTARFGTGLVQGWRAAAAASSCTQARSARRGSHAHCRGHVPQSRPVGHRRDGRRVHVDGIRVQGCAGCGREGGVGRVLHKWLGRGGGACSAGAGVDHARRLPPLVGCAGGPAGLRHGTGGRRQQGHQPWLDPENEGKGGDRMPLACPLGLLRHQSMV